MKNSELLVKLIELLEKLDIELRFDNLEEGSGGLCTLKGKQILVLDKNSTVEESIDKITGVLQGLDLSEHHLPPALRQAIYGGEGEWQD